LERSLPYQIDRGAGQKGIHLEAGGHAAVGDRERDGRELVVGALGHHDHELPLFLGHVSPPPPAAGKGSVSTTLQLGRVVFVPVRVLPRRSACLPEPPAAPSRLPLSGVAWIRMDVLSAARRVIRLKRALFLHAEFGEPWCVAASGADGVAQNSPPTRERIADCHLVV